MFSKRGTLALVCVATAMLMLDIAVVNTALPRIAHDLHSGLSGVQWVIDAYTLTLASVVLSAGDYLFAPREVAHAYVVRSERARMLGMFCPAGLEQLAVSLGVPVTGAEPPTDAVMPPMDEMVRLFGAYGCEILGPPLSIDEL